MPVVGRPEAAGLGGPDIAEPGIAAPAGIGGPVGIPGPAGGLGAALRGRRSWPRSPSPASRLRSARSWALACLAVSSYMHRVANSRAIAVRLTRKVRAIGAGRLEVLPRTRGCT